MTNKLLSVLMGALIFVTPLAFSFSGEDLGEKVPTLEFFQKIQGQYQIILVGNQVPKEDNKMGYVSLENDELTMVLPYCHKNGGVCDPGFRNFTSVNTEVYQKNLEPNYSIFALLKKDADKTFQYTWEVRNGIVHFLDPQYTLVSGEVFPLEFILEKAPEPPPTPVEP